MINYNNYLKEQMTKFMQENSRPATKEDIQRNLRWFHDKGVEISWMDIERIHSKEIKDLNEDDKELLNKVFRVVMDNLEEWIKF